MYSILKRIIDIFICTLALIILFPVFILIALCIKLESKGPVFFMQKRVGRKNTHFNMIKFRTMRIDAPKDMPTHLLNNPESYITKVGSFLRRTSLDELPQLINVIKGEMSIIGPRPALWNQYDLIAARDKGNVSMLYPGLTGWAQVNGRDELPIPVKAGFDCEYAEKISLSFDIRILALTVKKVLSSDGVKEGGVK